MDLSTKIAGLSLKNPLVAASGAFPATGEEYAGVGDIRWFGLSRSRHYS